MVRELVSQHMHLFCHLGSEVVDCYSGPVICYWWIWSLE